MWQKWRQILLNPSVDPDLLEQALTRASEQQPPPVLWLLGKTQSGKTSIIRALTGSGRAEIGNGFEPCTRTAYFFDFPYQAPVVRFLDTRGLGERDYDPEEDLRYCEQQSHLVVAVMKASDQDQSAVWRVLETVRRRHPHWPVLLVQTALHELYEPGQEHGRPWPFQDPALAHCIPGDLQRCLAHQQASLRALPGEGRLLSVPVDLTLPEDGFEPQHYGLEALWDGIEAVSSLGLQSMLQGDAGVVDAYSRAAHPHIIGHSLAAAALGAIPLVDVALIPTLQVKLLQSLASLYGFRWDRRRATEFFGLLGAGLVAGYGLRWAGRGLVKLIPVWGQTAGAVWGASSSAAVTFALGKAACYYLARKSEGMAVDATTLRSIYAEAFRRGVPLGDSSRPGPEEPGP
ncbi:MAG: GTPase [Oleiphilaceae bacterium]|nr:GTPase [Oleiphilaceae bacterium]